MFSLDIKVCDIATQHANREIGLTTSVIASDRSTVSCRVFLGNLGVEMNGDLAGVRVRAELDLFATRFTYVPHDHHASKENLKTGPRRSCPRSEVV